VKGPIIRDGTLHLFLRWREIFKIVKVSGSSPKYGTQMPILGRYKPLDPQKLQVRAYCTPRTMQKTMCEYGPLRPD
jgi:hypothetical protein